MAQKEKIITTNCPSCDNIIQIKETTATVLCMNCKNWSKLVDGALKKAGTND